MSLIFLPFSEDIAVGPCCSPRMAHFVPWWASLLTLTLLSISFEKFRQRPIHDAQLAFVAILLLSACWQAIYWSILYPAYFTPFRHLPTPKVCKFNLAEPWETNKRSDGAYLPETTRASLVSQSGCLHAFGPRPSRTAASFDTTQPYVMSNC